MRRLGVLVAIAIVGLPSARASAGARPPPDPGPAPIPVLEVTGAGTIEDLRIEVQCDGGGVIEVDALCRVHATFSVRAGDAEVALTRGIAPHPFGGRWTGPGGAELDPAELRVDGAPLVAVSMLAPGATALVEIDASRRIATHREYRETPWIVAPMIARHFVLGETRDVRHHGARLSAPIVAGDRIAIAGEVSVDARDHGPTRVTLAGDDVDAEARIAADASFRPDLELVLDVPPDHEGPFAHGGPVIALGDRIDFAVQTERWFLRVGYELGLAEYVLGSLELETDFDSVMEALVIEVASPGLIVFIPSVSAGVGIVARQLGPRDPDAALRLRLGAVLSFVGVTVDLDYWPAIADWSATIAVRISA